MSEAGGILDTTTKMPEAGSFDLSRAAAAAAADSEAERNTVFGSLVTGDADIVGLVAYSIYKQNKHDWLVAFTKSKAREPNDAELTSYIIGESTPRRLATYRHLAQATLDGRGPEVSASPSNQGFSLGGVRTAQSGAVNQPLLWFGLTLIVLVGAYLAARYGLIKI
ncbi:hypothetical protein PY365_25860 [Roseiarcaceae bacterium H3SJ34-1]|uniref:hypothetical protein n=1 Tax=Terripilifer ovatus TaxID=3032367 RepID=UPI003AB929F4|nr:hypothetical protein [Roseiarcaceae bacterium H3SJ34-1]